MKVNERTGEIVKEDVETDDNTNDGILVKEEEMEEGVVKVGVYWSYWVSVGMILAPVVLLSLFLMQGESGCG